MCDNKYTVVVSSCDSYEDLWDPFFQILKTEWPELEQRKIPIILNTESKSYSYDGLNIRTMKLFGPLDNPSWTARLRRTLELVDTDYVVTLLDDYFMQGRVNDQKINQHVQWLEDNRWVVAFCYKENYTSNNKQDHRFEGFERRPLVGEYKLNAQPTLWRKSALIKYLKKDENPWEWELYGNWRTYRHPMDKFYSIIPGSDYVFTHLNNIKGITIGGCLLHGRWYLPVADRILKKNGIEIDYSIRGTISEEEFIEPIRPEKRKEDVSRWKQLLWFTRPLYIGIKHTSSRILYVIQHLEHFF